MGGRRRLLEMDFELALTSNLEEVYGLRVRSERDPLNRAKSGFITLRFAYDYRAGRACGCATLARVRVSVEGRALGEYRFHVDLADPDAVDAAAADCEDLALGLCAHLECRPPAAHSTPFLGPTGK